MVTNIKTEKIMKKILNLSIVFLAALLLSIGFNSCEDENDYDFSKIVPVLSDISAETYTPMEGRHHEFWATTRGGSSYTWTTELTATWVENADHEGQWKTFIYFPDVITLTDDPEFVFVTETTAGGVTSNMLTSDTIFTVMPFAPRAILGDAVTNGGFTAAFSADVNEGDKQHSTYAWTCTAGTVTVNTDTWMAEIAFTNDHVGVQTITMTETTDNGFTDASTFDVTVLEYCALDNGALDLAGAWFGTDAATYYTTGASTVSIKATEESLTISNLGVDWMTNFWGEIVTAGGSVTIDYNEDGTIVIPNQYYMSTTYNGDVQDDYTIEGAGRWNNCGAFTVISIVYEMNNGQDWGAWTYNNGYSDTPHFEAELTLDPSGKLVKSETNVKFDLRNKPVK
jgi:hypothetical protein